MDMYSPPESSSFSRDLDSLNPQQREAVLTTEGPVLLLAGAGSGKTRVLTYRIANLVLNHGADPSEIFAVTFTNKAAGEMRERVKKLLGYHGANIWVSTFHSACVKILRNNIEAVGRDRNFVIYDDKEQMDVIKKVLLQLDMDPEYYQPRAIASFIDKQKNDGLMPGAVAMQAISKFDEKVPLVYKAYQEEMARNNAFDFGDLLLQTIHLFEQAPHVAEQYRQNLKYIMVDEYQDTNRAQYLLVKHLTGTHRNLCVVGDDDQSIYSWRGADIRNILEFNRDYAGAAVIKLEQNYRSTKNILAAAQKVVEKNQKRSAKTLWTDNPDGELITLYTAEDDRDEARFVLETIRKEQREGRSLRDMAIMYRMNSLSRVFEEGLLQTKIPYQVVGGMKFYERKEIKDLLSMLRLLLNPVDNASFRRVVENFTKGIGKTTLDKVEDFARTTRTNMISGALGAVSTGALGGAAGKKMAVFIQLLTEMQGEINNYGIREFAGYLLEKSGYLEELQRQNTEESRSRVENLGELLSSMEEFEERNPGAQLPAYLDQVALVSDVDTMEETDQLTLMTLHSAKGLEYPVVFLVGLEQNIFPHSRCQSDPTQLEEERRLCYVGITRAEKRLFLSHAKRRRLWGDYEMFHPSQFLGDIPPLLLKRIAPAKPEWLNLPASGKFRSVDYENGGPGARVHPAEPVARQMDSKVGKFSQGCKVSHPTFGVGLVVYAEGDADNPKLTVKFESGIKKIMARYVPLEVVG
jgi:DNA helicase-2/ATP-dependent DNA helicase PcrA